MKTITTLLIFLFTLFGLQADNDSIASIRFAQFIQNAHSYSQLNPQEKVYLHFDNTGYFEGETIWFKAYVVTAKNNKPTDLSRILYVELLDPEGKIIDERKLKIENGQCHGEFILDKQIRAGYYEVRAYTRYMLNFGDDLIFSRIFPVLTSYDLSAIDKDAINEVGNQDVNSPFLEKMRTKVRLPKKKQLFVHFYPEGGNLIQGISTKVAFKATDEQGKSVEIEGTLFNPDKEEIQTIQTLHQGMGAFEFTPDNLKKYYVEVWQGKKKHKFELPVALPNGYTMNLNRLNDEEQEIMLQKTSGIHTDTLGLVVSCRGSVVHFETIYNNQFPLSIKLDDGTFPEGVNRLTLFDKKGEILSDRLFFIKREQTSTLTVTTDKDAYQPYEKIKMNLHLTGTQPTSFSLAIRDGSKEPDYLYDDIRSNLLLSSELKGYIENPAYYFERQDDKRTQALDLLMLVQGWRRYSWEDAIINTKHNREHYIEREILIKGKILSDKEKLPLEGVLVTIQMSGADSILRQGRYLTGKDGDFIFYAEEFDGRKDLLFITDKDDEPIQTKITLDRQIAPVARTYPFVEIAEAGLFKPLPQETDETIQSSLQSMQYLSEVTVKAKKIRRPIVYEVNREVTYYRDLGLDLPYGSIHSYLLHRNKRYQADGLSYVMQYRGTSGAIGFFDQNGIWKDRVGPEKEGRKLGGYEAFHLRSIIEFDQIKIFFEGEAADHFWKRYPENYIKGRIIILIIPFERTIRDYVGTRYTHLQGYSKTEASFQQPDYENNPPIRGEIDYRRTLYWNPNMQSDELIEFYNNSTCKELVISAEGITEDGKIIQFVLMNNNRDE